MGRTRTIDTARSIILVLLSRGGCGNYKNLPFARLEKIFKDATLLSVAG
jgi:hypothetical protein